jgi:hypothetical protein
MALPLDGAGSTESPLSFAKEMGPAKRNAIALNASRRLASGLQARQNAVTLLKTLLRMRALLFLGSEFGEQHSIDVKSAT